MIAASARRIGRFRTMLLLGPPDRSTVSPRVLECIEVRKLPAYGSYVRKRPMFCPWPIYFWLAWGVAFVTAWIVRSASRVMWLHSVPTAMVRTWCLRFLVARANTSCIARAENLLLPADGDRMR